MPQAQLLVLIAWAAVGLILLGLGSLFRAACRAAAKGGEDLLLSFWLGWACLVLGLQVWHLLLPVDGRARVACAAAGAVGLLASGFEPWRRMLGGVRRGWLALAGLAAAAVWLSNHALDGARHGDSGAYFIPTVRWLLEYPIVPGLANLHAHYALNQSYFLYVAALEAGPFVHRSFHLANGLLLLALCARLALAMGRLLRLGRSAKPVDLFFVLLLPGVLPLGAGIFLTSPSPDMAVFTLGGVAAAELLALLTDDAPGRDFHLRAATLLAMTGVTVKLSFAGFAAALLPVALLSWLWLERPGGTRIARAGAAVALLGLLAMGPWIARNVVMSGYPLFPSAMGALPVEWRVGTDVEGWLRNSAYLGGMSAMLRNPGWVLGRLGGLGWGEPHVVGPLLVALVAGVAAIVRRLLGGRTPPEARLPLLLTLPALASLIFCLVISPVPRYAGATVWVLAASAVMGVFGDVVGRPRTLLRLVVLVAVVGATVLALRAATDPLWLPLADFASVSPVRYAQRRLKTGFVVNIPRGPAACWDAPLPCTPYPNPALRLRRDGDLRAGFMLDPALQARYRYDPGHPFLRR